MQLMHNCSFLDHILCVDSSHTKSPHVTVQNDDEMCVQGEFLFSLLLL